MPASITPPDSLKAKFCVEGREMLYEACEEHTIPYREIGKPNEADLQKR
jgi:L-2-hydroxyglutarate oxidase LhgO